MGNWLIKSAVSINYTNKTFFMYKELNFCFPIIFISICLLCVCFTHCTINSEQFNDCQKVLIPQLEYSYVCSLRAMTRQKLRDFNYVVLYIHVLDAVDNRIILEILWSSLFPRALYVWPDKRLNKKWKHIKQKPKFTNTKMSFNKLIF